MPRERNKMTTYALDPELFIKEIKKYKELWGLSNDGYKYKTKDRQAAWSEVAKIFIPDFNTMKEVEKAEVYRILQSKWRNIRDSYVRNFKRKDGKRGYMYAKLLTFLNNRYDNQSENLSSDDDSSDEDNKVLSASKSRNIEIAGHSDEDTSTIVNLKRRRIEKHDKIEFVDTPSIQNVETMHNVEDEDRSFFDSLLPAVREFDLDQKLEFRCEVLKLIKHIRSGANVLKPEFNAIDYD